MKPFVVFALNAMVLALVGVMAWGVWLSRDFATTPPEEPGRNVTVVIRPGTPFSRVSRRLEELGAVSDAHSFTVFAETRGKTGAVRAGEFALNTAMLPGQVLDELTTGRGILHKLQVREGLTWWQTAELVDRAGLGTVEDFRAAVMDPELLAEYGIPAESLEGYLFPDTYAFTRADRPDARKVVRTMVDTFFKKASEVWPEGMPDPVALYRMVTLASLVEKETGDVTERPRIAGVFSNRLDRRMLLQCDPTIIYGLGESFDGNLKRSHLKDSSNPYNTYARPGLPPRPHLLAGPGRPGGRRPPRGAQVPVFRGQGRRLPPLQHHPQGAQQRGDQVPIAAQPQDLPFLLILRILSIFPGVMKKIPRRAGESLA